MKKRKIIFDKDFPNDCIYEILLYLDFKSTIKLRSLTKLFKYVIDNIIIPKFWKFLPIKEKIRLLKHKEKKIYTEDNYPVPDDYFICVECKRPSYIDITYSCEKCNIRICEACSFSYCEDCETHFCNRCISNCSLCNNERCEQCLISCNKCKLEFCKECLYVCKKCNIEFCCNCLGDHPK